MRIVFTMLLITCAAATASAQTTSASTEKPNPTLKERLQEPDQAGGLHLTEHFAVVFGGVKQGSGIALGPALSEKFSDGSFLQLKGVYSIKKFKLLQARYDSRKFWSDRGIVISRLRWLNAPELSLYQLGPLSPNARADFGERKTEGSSRIVLNPAGALRLAAGIGIERYSTNGGHIETKEGSGALPDVPPMPGLGTHPWFARTFASAAYDTRLSPDYSRSGHFAEIVIHHYNDTHNNQDSFRRLEGTLQQLVPTHGGRGVIDLSARTWLSFAEGDRSVPFFLMPTLGGGEMLRAFPSYRFRDRDALLLKGEYRWAVRKMADVAGVYEAGKVGAEIENLGLRDVAHSFGIGIRVHSKTSSLFRADLAHGREGFGFRIGFSAAGS
ncbi:MAG TPA: hypothetical protein VEL51_03935 [Vicinamibacterales bacterium]|nr:hypothetical protein [Vicinamibacterales bacterium]